MKAVARGCGAIFRNWNFALTTSTSNFISYKYTDICLTWCLLKTFSVPSINYLKLTCHVAIQHYRHRKLFRDHVKGLRMKMNFNLLYIDTRASVLYELLILGHFCCNLTLIPFQLQYLAYIWQFLFFFIHSYFFSHSFSRCIYSHT